MADADADESSGEEWQESGSETQAVVDDPTQPASKKPEELKPLGKLKKGFVWKPVHCNDALVHVRGGFSAEHLVAPSIPFPMGKVTYKFIELSKNATWFLKEVGGKSAKTGTLKGVNVVTELRHRYYHGPLLDATNAVAEDQSENADGDIMNCLDDLATPVPVPVAKAKAKGKAKGKSKDENQKRKQRPKHTPTQKLTFSY